MRKKIVVCLAVCAFLASGLVPAAFAQTPTSIGGSSSAYVPQFLEFSLKKVVRMESGVDSDPFNDGLDVSGSPSFNFGSLSKVTDTNPSSPTYGQFLYMRGQYFYYVIMIASTSGRRYHITETGSVLSGAGTTLPLGSVILMPDYNSADGLGGVAQGVSPAGSYLGPPTTACTTNTLVYQSGTSGLGRLVRAIIAISGPAAGSSYPYNYDLGYNGLGQPNPGGVQQLMDGSTGSHGNPTVAWTPVTTDQPSATYSGTITFNLVLG